VTGDVVTRFLHDSDDEWDLGVFIEYLRAQSDEDLADISVHLDPDYFPVRTDALRHELSRRGLPPPKSWPIEASFNVWSPDDAFPDLSYDPENRSGLPQIE